MPNMRKLVLPIVVQFCANGRFCQSPTPQNTFIFVEPKARRRQPRRRKACSWTSSNDEVHGQSFAQPRSLWGLYRGKQLGDLFVFRFLCFMVFNYSTMVNLGFRMDCNIVWNNFGNSKMFTKCGPFRPFLLPKHFQ